MSWSYKGPNGRSPAAQEVRVLTGPCRQFLRCCDGSELMAEIRSMLEDQPVEIVDATAMLDYLCDLRNGSRPKTDITRAQLSTLLALITPHCGRGVEQVLNELARAAGVPE